MTKVTSHQGTHTYRLSKFLKIIFAAPDPKARLQHRRKIMNPFLHFVKLNVHLTANPDSPTTAENTACCRRGPHSTALNTFVNTYSKIIHHTIAHLPFENSEKPSYNSTAKPPRGPWLRRALLPANQAVVFFAPAQHRETIE